MGKDKKEKNPMDAFRKDQRKKELLKLKKDREVVKGVRDLLNDPRKIDEEIAKAQKISDENKLDKTLKDKIKELQRMKDVANTRQLVLAAQGKKSLEEAESIIKPSIYQKNDGVWDDPSAKKAASHGHPKSASRISTEGLVPYTRAEDANLAAQMPLPTSVMMPYPPALIPNAFPRGLPGVPGMMPRGPVMGGMAGIPLPPPRPMPGMAAPYNHLAGAQSLPRGYPVPPPPPPLMAGSSSQSAGGNLVPPPPGPPSGPPPGYPMALFAQGFPGQVPYGYPPMGMPQPVPGMYSYAQPPFQPHFQHHQQAPRGAARPHQQQKERKPRPPRGTTEEVDPLDPAAQGYTERFGAAVPAKKAPVRHDDVPPPVVLPAVAPVPAPLLMHEVESHDVASASKSAVVAVEEQVSTPAPADVPPYASYGALSAEELMRRRHTIPDQLPEVAAPVDQAVGPFPGPPSAPAPFSYHTLSAEELLRRRHQIPDEVAVEVEPEEAFVPARPPVNYGAVLSAEELMRRRHMVQAPEPVVIAAPQMEKENADSYEVTPGPSMEDAEELLRRRFEIPEDVEANNEEDIGPMTGPSMGPGANTSAEELLRQKYEIPEYEVEDVESDEDNVDDGYEYRDQGRSHEENDHGDVSDDEVRSAGQPEPFFDEFSGENEENDSVNGEEAPEMNLNLRNLYPARLPASFTALPLPRSFAAPGLAPAPVPASQALPVKAPKTYSSAINFADYGDDESEEENNEEEEEDFSTPAAPKIQPYASAGPQAPAVLPARAPDNFPVSSYYPEGLQLDPEDQVISHAVVKGPKIMKADRALTAFVPNALKKKRLLSSVTSTNNASFTSYRKAAAASAVEAEEDVEEERHHDYEEGAQNKDEEEDEEEEHARKAARHELEQQRREQQQREQAAASLHAATSALFRPSSSTTTNSHSNSSAAGNMSNGAPVRPPIAPIAFVAATTTTKKVASAAPVDDDMALFFSEINQLDGV